MKLEQAVFRLVELMMKDSSLQNLVDEASRILERPIWVVDLRYRFLTNPESVFPINARITSTYQEGAIDREDLLYLHQKELIEAVDRNESPYVFYNETLHMKLVGATIRVKGVIVARLASCEAGRPIAEFDLSLLDKLKELLSLEFQRGSYRADCSCTTLSEIMGEMLEEKCMTMSHVYDCMDAVGYVLNPNLRLAVIYAPNKSITEFPWYMVAEQIAYVFPNSIYTSFHGNMVLLINQKQDISTFQLNEFSLALRECNLRAGLSYCFHDLSKCYRVYHDTCDLNFSAPQILAERACVRYEDYILELAASLLAGKMDPHSIAGDAVGKMLEYDRKYGQETMTTMRVYVHCACNIQRAAAELHIHENTLRYRIARIADFTGLDYKNGKTIFELMLAFALLDAECQK